MYWIGYYFLVVVVVLVVVVFVVLLLSLLRHCYYLLVPDGTNYAIKFVVVLFKVEVYEIAKVNF